MIASLPPTCLTSQSRYPGSEFSLTGPRWGAEEGPGWAAPPAPDDWQPAAAAGIAAAPAVMPMNARRERREGERMRPIMPEAGMRERPDTAQQHWVTGQISASNA